jgi:hypothetical protein
MTGNWAQLVPLHVDHIFILPSVRARTILLFARHSQLTQGGTDIILKKCQLFACCTEKKMTSGEKK